MQADLIQPPTHLPSETPLCPVFGACGGCAYQDLTYSEELKKKSGELTKFMAAELGISSDRFDSIVASPEPYHYRHRLDITMKRTKSEGILFGFQHAGLRRMIEIEACPIARKEVSDFLPELRKIATEKLPFKYRTANLVVRTSDDGRVLWGGIGRRSLSLMPGDYFFTEIEGKRIYFSLDTFFQANLGILPLLMKKIESLVPFTKQTVFYDLYAGVGLFGIFFADKISQLVMIEDSPSSVELLRYNLRQHHIDHALVLQGKVEEELPRLASNFGNQPHVAIIDPPRDGMKLPAAEALAQMKHLSNLLYLSCSPASLVRDLKVFLTAGWEVEKVVPFDFFPRTAHLETLVLLKPQVL